MQEMVNARDPNDRRTNYRHYLTTYSHYLTEIRLYEDAKKIFDDQTYFTEEEAQKAFRDIEIVQSFRERRTHK